MARQPSKLVQIKLGKTLPLASRRHLVDDRVIPKISYKYLGKNKVWKHETSDISKKKKKKLTSNKN